MVDLLVTEIAHQIGGRPVHTDPELRVSRELSASSASVVRDGIFVAIRGNAADGHSFIDDAFSRGAGVAVVEDSEKLNGRPGIVVANSRLALSRLASFVYGDPSRHMRVIGITGTNGKTTTNWIVYHALNRLGAGALRIGTLGTEYLGQVTREGMLTSPDPVSLHAVMAQAFQAGARACVMETSSHALDQARVEDVHFDVGVFTNLTRDHLDYHKTFDHYFASKAHLFELLASGSKGTRGAVINLDDPYGVQLWQRCQGMGLVDLSFGRDERAAFQIVRVEETPGAMEIDVRLPNRVRIRSLSAPFIGPHNAENVVAAFASLVGLGYDEDRVAEALCSSPQVAGRLERVGEGAPRVFVDYAHTPDALERVLRAVRVSTVGKVWCVFGCGGDRDRGKRPEMGRIAALCADTVVVTSDNPRTEDPRAIIEDILASGIAPAVVTVDRASAISEAIMRAAPDDTIVIAGKGHENYQILGTTKVHFSDQEEALKALSSRGSS
ncbi:MAG: UDP-N-acetylmuramoyl-L-alanyl-D-glutamate--2,6-diaminopimelate ligase [Pseudomonadota bacterium]